MQRRFFDTRGQTQPERMIADLVVVLQKRDKGGRRQPGRSLATRSVATEWRGFALIDKPLRQSAAEPGRGVIGVILIIAGGFPGDQHVQRVMKVIVPLGCEPL